ncbi:saccharopine dehydrogenase C-terminal domain-containing protein [Aestuariispira insulae]|uniref:Homospermidine synthase n=1 Tax=Aestuariispira insulae TaxID=1461337 RepID=A0A3D9H6B3_9PROT|nr:saccharopine dehydrogenase C-terminal domain-containing protein [Aestuariispira insulae]RED44691.1 homospermidine synthase [Aestuariispira insulae]
MAGGFVGKAVFRGDRILVLGFGSIGVTVLPLLFEHVDVRPDQVMILSDDDRNAPLRDGWGVAHEVFHLERGNLEARLRQLLAAGDCLVNLTEGVGSLDLVRICLENGIDYIDTSSEEWRDAPVPAPVSRLRAAHVEMREGLPKRATALITHGANPGLVSHFAKQALVDVAVAEGLLADDRSVPGDWSALAQTLKLQAVHFSERDSQYSGQGRQPGELVNTWSVEGLIEEACDPPSFAWGSHEKMVAGAEVSFEGGCRTVTMPGRAQDYHVKSWLPSCGDFAAFVLPHEETFSTADFLSGTDQITGEYWQPTVLFAYQPCDLAIASLHCHRYLGDEVPMRVLMTEIDGGVDELGALIIREGSDNVYWFGSTLDVADARKAVPHANATTLQVAAGLIAGLVWVLGNPNQGMVEPEELDHREILETARPYLGDLRGVWGTWR